MLQLHLVFSRHLYQEFPIQLWLVEMLLTQEMSNLERLSGEQRASRNWVLALSLLIIPRIDALTDNQEDEIAQSKGKIIAMQDEFTRRCLDDD